VGGVLFFVVLGVVIVAIAIMHRRYYKPLIPPGTEPNEPPLPHRRRSRTALHNPTEPEEPFRGPPVNTAASDTQPMGRRSSVGTVFEQVGLLLAAHGLGEWLFVDVDERVTGQSPLKAATGFYVRITVDTELSDSYIIERVPASQYLRLRSGRQDIHVFFARAKANMVMQGISVVEIPPPDQDLNWHIPTPDESVEAITRVPMTSQAGHMDAMRLATQLARAKKLTDPTENV
jgi:hypothetical protein